jgi:hypothetical protein
MGGERCFAMLRSGRCGALSSDRCPGYFCCAFYKPFWLQKRDCAASDRRLCALPEEKQYEIANKYHKGGMPWRGEFE